MRVNYRVVAKADKVSGKVSGRSSAGEVFNQVRQGSGSAYLDPVTTEQRPVGRCFVVTSKAIAKKALNSLQSLVKQGGLEKVTELIDGEKLWELIELHLASWTVPEELERIRDRDWRGLEG